MSWINIVARVASVAAGLFDSIMNPAAAGASSTEGSATPYKLGDAVWYHDPSTSKISVLNVSETDLTLSYGSVKPDGTSLTVLQPLPAYSRYDATQDILDFKEGDIGLVRSPEVTAGGPSYGPPGPPKRRKRNVIVSLPFIVPGIIYTLFGGNITLNLNMNKTIIIRNNISSQEETTVSFQNNNNEFNANADGPSDPSQSGANEPGVPNIYIVTLPPGVDMNSEFTNVRVQMSIDSSAYAALTAERLALVTR